MYGSGLLTSEISGAFVPQTYSRLHSYSSTTIEAPTDTHVEKMLDSGYVWPSLLSTAQIAE